MRWIDNTILKSIELILARVVLQVMARQDNALIDRIIELQTALLAIKASTGNVSSIRDAIPNNFLPTSQRTKQQIRQAFTDAMGDGSGGP